MAAMADVLAGPGGEAGDLTSLIDRARRFAAAGRWQEAAQAYHRVLAVPGEHRVALAADIGAALYKAQRYQEAQGVLADAVLANPGDHKSARRLALAVKNAGDLPGTGAQPERRPSSAPPDRDRPIPPRVDDPARVLAELAACVAGQRVSGRLAATPVDFLGTGYPELDYASHPGYGAAVDLPAPDVEDVAAPVYKAFASIWNHYVELRAQAGQLPVPERCAGAFRDLERDGISQLRMTDDELAELVALTDAAALGIRARRERLEPRRRGVEACSWSLYHARTNRTGFVDFLERIFNAHDVLAMASAYQGVEMAIKLANLQINSAEDTSIAGNCTVGDLPLSPGYYLHIDSGVGTMKMIICRSRVTAETGAFRYVAGSNRIGTTPFELCLRKASDKSNYDSCKTGDRARFARLPAFLQKKANFGNDLLAGDPDLDWLLDRERIMEGEPGAMLLFDNNGIHRGAIFDHGEREIIQVLLMPASGI